MPTPNDVPILIRRTHEERILATLREAGPLTRAELEERVGLSRTTLSEITADLLRRGALVEREPQPRAGRGRPAGRVALDPASGQFLGVDLGHRRVHVAVVNASNDVIASGGRGYPIETPWAQRIDATLALIDELTGAAGIRLTALEGVGIGVPGPVSSPFRGASQITSRWHALNRDAVVEHVRTVFEQRFAVPLVVDNNTRFAGLGEAVWGPARETDSLLFIRLSDGVGGALVVGGRLVSGAFGAAGELGHVTVDPDGATCWCGKAGCLETVASVPSVLARAEVDDIDAHSASLDAAVAEAGRATGSVLAAAAGAVDPREVVVAGEMLRFPGFLDAVRTTFEREIVPVASASRLRPSALSVEAGALGAIAAAFHRSPLLVGYPGVGTDADLHGPERRQA